MLASPVYVQFTNVSVGILITYYIFAMDLQHNQGTQVFVLRACYNDDATDLLAIGGEHSVDILLVVSTNSFSHILSPLTPTSIDRHCLRTSGFFSYWFEDNRPCLVFCYSFAYLK
jgi:hypothetical protein